MSVGVRVAPRVDRVDRVPRVVDVVPKSAPQEDSCAAARQRQRIRRPDFSRCQSAPGVREPYPPATAAACTHTHNAAHDDYTWTGGARIVAQRISHLVEEKEEPATKLPRLSTPDQC